MSIIGAVYGALLVNWAKTSFSESFPELWLFAMGGLFIAVVMLFPNGLAGLYNKYVAPRINKFIASFSARRNETPSKPISHPKSPAIKPAVTNVMNEGALHDPQ